MRIRTLRQAKAIRNSNAQIVKDATVGGMRQMRCGSCHGMMTPGRHHNGTEVMKCLGCGKMATTRPM